MPPVPQRQSGFLSYCIVCRAICASVHEKQKSVEQPSPHGPPGTVSYTHLTLPTKA